MRAVFSESLCPLVVAVVVALLCICLSEGSFESQCVESGTEVTFYCPDEEEWKINSRAVDDDVPGQITFMSSEESGRNEHMIITAGPEYVEDRGNVSLIHCLGMEHHNQFFALLIINEPEAEQPLFPELLPLTWTSLLLQWTLPDCPSCFAINFVDFKYTVRLTTESGASSVETAFNNSMELMLEGYECDVITVEVSLPGNCQPATVSGALLLDPVYPKPTDLSAILLNSTSFALTWNHPDTSELEEEDQDEHLSYSIKGVLVSNSATVLQYSSNISSDVVPWEVVDLSDWECQDVELAVSLERDCRELFTTVSLPLFPVSFASEAIHVELFFTPNLDLKKIEVSFPYPEMCDSQEANYTIAFTERASGYSWESVSKQLMVCDGDSVEVDVTEVELFKLETGYNVTVTISTVVGNVSSSTEFDTCTPFGAPRNLSIWSLNEEDVVLYWERRPMCSSFSPVTVIYNITAYLVDTGRRVYDGILPVTGDQTRSMTLHVAEYACRAINYSVSLYQRQTTVASLVYTLPLYPNSFGKKVEAEVTLKSDGSFKHIEIKFIPPKLCEFQRSSYVMSYSAGNETWSGERVVILDSSRVVKEEINSDVRPNTEYTIIVTVMTELGNLSSNTTITYQKEVNQQTSISVTKMSRLGNHSAIGISTVQDGKNEGSNVELMIVMGVVVVGLVVSVAASAVAVFFVRQLKRRREKTRMVLSARRPNGMIMNPLYDGIDEGHYEQLPDCRGQPPPSIPLSSAPTLHTPTTPHLPPPRSNSATQDRACTKHIESLALPESKSLSCMSTYSSEDCYTVMSSAGTVTILPRLTTTAATAAVPTDGEEGKCLSVVSDKENGEEDDDNISV